MRFFIIFVLVAFQSISGLAYSEESDSEARDCSELKPCKVGVKTLVFFDVSRERPVITEVYYPSQRNLPRLKPTSNNFHLLRESRDAPIPSDQDPLPLVVLSHGYLGDRYAHLWLQEILAANGYIVAVPDHFGSTHYMHRPEDSLKRWDQPKDISLVIENLLKDPFFKGHINPDKIGFIGYAQGGLTGIWLAGGIATNYPTPNAASSPPAELDGGATQKIIDSIDFSKAKKKYEDKRIKAAFLMAPGYGAAFNKEGLACIDIPILIVATEGDTVYPVKENAQYFADNIKSSDIKVLRGDGSHTVFLSEEEKTNPSSPSSSTQDKAPEDLKRLEVHEEVAAMAIKFFNKYLKEQAKCSQ